MLLDMQESTGITPQALKNKPAIDSRLAFIHEAFLEMHSERGYLDGGHPRRLSFGVALKYAQLYELTMAEARWLWGYIKIIDRGWCDAHSEKVKMQSKDSTKVR